MTTIAQIEYVGNGVQRDFTFPFEYNKAEVEVAFWDLEKEAGQDLTEGLMELLATTIQFNTAPDYKN